MKRHLLSALVIIAINIRLYLLASATCPTGCVCKVLHGSRFMNVSCQGPTIPHNFPTESLSITIEGVYQSQINPNTFINLKNLKYLKIFKSHINSILNTSLAGLENLEYLRLIDCDIRHIHRDAFRQFSSIEHIDLSDNSQLTLGVAKKALNSFNNFSSLQFLNLRNINTRKTGSIVLETSFWKFLQHTNITTVNLGHNELGIIKPGFAKYLYTLKHLIMSNNILIGEDKSFHEIFKLHNLRYLDLSDQKIMTDGFVSDNQAGLIQIGEESSCLQYPPYLETIIFRNFRSLTFHHTPWVICPNNSVTFLDISSIHATDISYIFGLDKLKHIYFMNNNCRKMTTVHFFRYFPRLVTALFGGNKLGYYIENDVNGSLFGENRYLKNLDFSYNEVRTMPESFLRSVNDLRILNISGNMLHSIDNFHLIKRPSLINVSFNTIHEIPLSLMHKFDSVGENFTLDISNNPISLSRICCNVRDFINWVKSTTVTLAQLGEYLCIHDNKLIHMESVSITVLDKECPRLDSSQFQITITIFLMFVIIVSLATFLYRKRYILKWWTILFRRYTTAHAHSENLQPNIIYDAYIVYSSDDIGWVRGHLESELENRRGYSLCIHDRDFTPGFPIDLNIEDAIRASRHTILLLSRNFQRSDWCDFELRMVEYHSRQHQRYNIIPIALNSFDFDQASLYVNTILHENPFIPWTNNATQEALFWDTLVREIGTPQGQ